MAKKYYEAQTKRGYLIGLAFRLTIVTLFLIYHPIFTIVFLVITLYLDHELKRYQTWKQDDDIDLLMERLRAKGINRP
jgi:hypothetical protein